MLKQLSKVAYRLFGKYVYKYRDEFLWLFEDIKKARLPYSLDEYLSLIVLISILVFLLSFTGSFMLFNINDVLIRMFLSILVSIGIVSLTISYFMNYPRLKAISRASEIDSVLPLAVMHMATLAGSGIPPQHIFRIMGKIERYGEISKDCDAIYRDITIGGKDIFTAISDAAKMSPSHLWTEILWGMESTLRAGGSLRDYFYTKSRELQSYLERKYKESEETMNMITEMYLIIFVVGPIFAAIMLILSSFMGGVGFDPIVLFSLLTYVIIPVVGIIFLLLAESAKPRGV